MALVTRCSSCGTTYKIYPEQLQIQNGFVRCGECRAVFNGFATLITVDESEIEYPSTLEAKNASDQTTADIARSALLADEKHYGITEPYEDRYDEKHADDGTEQHSISLTPVDAVTFEPKEQSRAEPVSDFLFDEKQPKTREYWTWMAASIGLFLLLIIQGVYAFRADLVKSFPQSRSALAGFCVPLGCSLPFPENIQLLSIVYSDLEVRDPEHYPEVLTLNTIFRNHATYAQALPALQLSLTDRHDQLLASRVFTADEYLPKAQKGVIAIKRGQELAIQLYIDNSKLKSSGYRVELLYL